MDASYDHVSIEGMAANGSGPDEHDPVIDGSVQLTLLAGGAEPTTATVKLRGGSVAVEGAFDKGDYVTLSIECRVGEVHFVDKIDKHGIVVGTERRHIAHIERVARS